MNDHKNLEPSNSTHSRSSNGTDKNTPRRGWFLRWATKDPAEDMLPMLTIGIFMVVFGAIAISLSVDTSTILVIIGTVLAILGGGVVAMALVLSAVRRGRLTYRDREDRHRNDSHDKDNES